MFKIKVLRFFFFFPPIKLNSRGTKAEGEAIRRGERTEAVIYIHFSSHLISSTGETVNYRWKKNQNVIKDKKVLLRKWSETSEILLRSLPLSYSPFSLSIPPPPPFLRWPSAGGVSSHQPGPTQGFFLLEADSACWGGREWRGQTL